MNAAENGSSRPVIHIDGVKKIYRMGENEVFALRGVDLTVHAGEMIAVMGSSGSGKSTLMNILGCLDVPSEGAYWLDGTRVDNMSKNQLADIRNEKLGFVFQGFNLLARTSAIENVELPLLYDRSGRARDTKAVAADALRRVGLGDRLDHQPSELSGGQQQRVAIARALVKEPPLILCDEPTGSLDLATGRHVLAVLRNLAREGHHTVLLVTHNSAIARMADRVIRLRSGSIASDDEVARPAEASELEW